MGIGTDSYMNVIKACDQAVRKNGQLKVKGDKKKTKQLRFACLHHGINKKGKMKSWIRNNGDGKCVCKHCGAVLTTAIADRDEIEEISSKVLEYVDEAAFMATEVGAGNEAICSLTQGKVFLNQLPKIYTSVAEVAKKDDQMKHGKKNKGSSGASKLSSWYVN